MMEYSPGQYLKVLVLEGSLRLSRNGSFGDSLVLHARKNGDHATGCEKDSRPD